MNESFHLVSGKFWSDNVFKRVDEKTKVSQHLSMVYIGTLESFFYLKTGNILSCSKDCDGLYSNTSIFNFPPKDF